MKKDVPRNKCKKFKLTLDEDMFQEMKQLEHAVTFGRDLDEVAELLVWEFPLNKDTFMRHGLSWDDVWKQGYMPLLPGRSRRTFYENDTYQVNVVVGGVPRYFVETLPQIEHQSNKRNRFYQRSPEEVLMHMIRHELPKKLAKARERDLLEDDSSL